MWLGKTSEPINVECAGWSDAAAQTVPTDDRLVNVLI
jgi:hypothetical protein